MNRRALLTAFSGLTAMALTPEAVHAAAALAAAPEWLAATTDIESDIAEEPLRLVHGKAPAGLAGTLYRNGPGKFRRPGGSVSHWFDGDGLVRAFRIGDGQARLSAKFVDTEKRRIDTAADAVVCAGFGTRPGLGLAVQNNDTVNAANTSLAMMGGELWALWEAGSPIALDPASLETRGVKTLRKDLAHMPFTAHPRIEPNGRLWNLGQSHDKAIVWRVAPTGELEKAELIQLPRASYIHDFTATDRHLVIVLQPWVQERFVLPMSASFAWKPEMGTQVLVLDKDDLSRHRIYELPAFFFFHLGDAWADSAGAIRFDACIDRDPMFAMKGAQALLTGERIAGHAPQLALITLRADGRASLARSGSVGEFPRGDARLAGVRRRYTTHSAVRAPDQPLFRGVAVTDWESGRTQTFDYGAHHAAEELLFVPRPGAAAEFDGWLVGTSLDMRGAATELHVFDARRVADGPLATWRASRPLPVGFHGVFA